MSTPNSRWSSLIAELVRRTSRGELDWRYLAPSQIGSSDKADEEVTAAYQASVEHQPVRLVEYQARHYTDEDQFYTYDGIRLEILRSGTAVSFEVPTREGLLDLKQAITKKLTGAEDLLDKLGL